MKRPNCPLFMPGYIDRPGAYLYNIDNSTSTGGSIKGWTQPAATLALNEIRIVYGYET